MPSALTSAVRSALSSFLASRCSDGGEIESDVLRAVRDEASLWLERQSVRDAFDADPFELQKDDKAMAREIERAKAIMNVLSCTRCTTMDGFSTINCCLEFQKDAKMSKDVGESVRLTFAFERRPCPREEILDDGSSQGECKNTEQGATMMERGGGDAVRRGKKRKLGGHDIDGNGGGTHVSYSIDLSRDHGKKERLLTVEVLAPGDAPSHKGAVPMDDDGEDDVWEDFDGDSEEEVKDGTRTTLDDKEEEKKESSVALEDSMQGGSSSEGIIDDGKDRFCAYVDPDILIKFLSWTRFKLDEAASLYFLMTFPFYEHEWDLAGYLMDAVFGEDNDDMSEEEELRDTSAS